MNLEVCGIGHPLGLFFGVFQLLLFFVKNNVACLTVASQQPLSRGAGGLGGRGDSHRELTRRIVYKNHA